MQISMLGQRQQFIHVFFYMDRDEKVVGLTLHTKDLDENYFLIINVQLLKLYLV